MKNSDVVVIMEQESTVKTEATDEQGGHGRLTTAKVLATFKGKVGTEITIHHFFYHFSPQAACAVIFPATKPAQARFDVGTASYFIQPTRKYLAFLKQQPDGSFVPATAQIDSEYAFITMGNNLRFLHHFEPSMEDEFTQKPAGKVLWFVEKPQP